MRTSEHSNSSISDVTKEPDLQEAKLVTEVGFDQENAKVTIDDLDERKTVRYIDIRILPILAATYAFSLIDRINLSSAFVSGMAIDLKLQVGNRYSIIAVLYFVPFILFQIPANAILRRVGVRNWLSFIVIAWGAVQLAMGFVKHWGWLVLCRVLIGCFEAGFGPAMVFIISTWYKRHEVHKRLALFYLSSGMISGFSPVLSYALSLLNGKQNITGWSWIFIIEGAITLALGILVYFFIPDFPDKNTFLTKAQTTFVLLRVEEDRGDSIPDGITTRKVFHHLGDWTIWIYGIMLACSTLPAYMLTFFLPIILRGMNFTTAQSLLLSSPQLGFAFLSAMFFAWISDRSKHRATFIAIQSLLTLIGCSMTAFAESTAARYAGTFFATAGAMGCIPSILAWGANNVVSHSKRSVQSAVTVAGSGVGGIIASTVFRQQDSPEYIPGLWVTIGAQILCIGLALMMSLRFYRVNRLCREGRLVGPLEGRVGFFYTT
ncbi:hypothetical protein E1B28_002132 [Marasmius oreades]|uniref:Major facilitator superfamily (MFS) profile domain-containing protein n=1 Tax=Marasmius oreades TaxID=181124 RepID=A0A9P7RNJ2_9AGAR|nr:uncharacterized protein E1B28_002132 [Marasmius oreades]KAG7086173.1 hypothetical protein E1B28_002132 [Marasmius oreades]